MHSLLIHELWLVGLFVGLMLFAHWFTYCMGSPLADPSHVDPGAILFFIPYFLAKRRMKGNLFDQFVESWRGQLDLRSDKIGAAHALRDHRLNVVVEGRVLFRWERAFLCPVCLHWWLSLLVWLVWVVTSSSVVVLWLDLPVWAFTYLFTHLIIRKL